MLLFNLEGHLDPARITTHLGVSCYLYKWTRIRRGGRKDDQENQPQRATRKTQGHTLSSLSKALITKDYKSQLWHLEEYWGSRVWLEVKSCSLQRMWGWNDWVPLKGVVEVVFISLNHHIAIASSLPLAFWSAPILWDLNVIQLLVPGG
jgi:hypothetical protein